MANNTHNRQTDHEDVDLDTNVVLDGSLSAPASTASGSTVHQALEDINAAIGGSSLIVTDGVTTVSPTSEIDVNGGTVNDLGGGVAEIVITGGGGGSITVKKLDGTGSVGSVTILRVAKLVNNTGGDVSLLPMITGTGTGNAAFETHYVGLTSPDGRTFVTAGDVPGSGAGSTGAYIGSEHTPAALANKGINLQAGNDYLGLYLSEKNSSTFQIYPDISNHHAVELVDLGASGHFKTVSDDQSETTDLANLHYLKHGTADPSAGAGVASAIGSFYGRDNSGAGELWFKTGAADTAWTRVTVP